ncbi:MAG: PIN-like domain-containing protein [Streptosporangiaceae bacterium]
MTEFQSVETGSGLYDGFEGYRTVTEADYRHLLTDGLVVPDTNVFLNLYRYNEQTRSDLFKVMTGLGDRLWVPNQVILEFWRNRESVLRDPRDTDKTSAELTAQREEAIGIFRAWANRVGLPPLRSDQLISSLNAAFAEVITGVAELADDDASKFARDTSKDPVLAGLEPILDGHVGSRMDQADYELALQEAKKRGEKKQPPGYKDAGKQDPAAAAGDYLIWTQILREAKRRERDVLIVTGDVKEDWWRREHGELRGPRPELVDEMRLSAGARLFMMRPETLLLHASQILQVEVQEESVQDIERVAEAENGGWSEDALGHLLARLSSEGWDAQEQSIRLAALRGGFVEREIVYKLGGYDAERSLRGFTRPINRITREFREDGVIPSSAIDVLATEYDPASGKPVGWASGFRVPDVLVPLVRSWARGHQARTAMPVDPERLAAALDEFRKLGHDVDEGAQETGGNGLPLWRCRRCGSYFTLESTDQRWVSPSGRSPCSQ